jgi:hypothetical protein
MYVLKRKNQHEYQLEQLKNADQNMVFFDIPESTTVNSAGE